MSKDKWPKRKIILLPIVIAIIAIIVYFVLIPQLFSQYDKFGIKKIYGTKIGGRVWFIDMHLPMGDGFFKPTVAILRQPDGSWQTHFKHKIGKNYEIRMLVTAPRFYDEWKNIEATGYMKVVFAQSKNASIGWSAREGIYNSSNPCADIGIKGSLYINGTSFWQKTISHNVHTDETSKTSVTHPILGRWIGWKVVIFNIRNDTAVRMLSYIDGKDNGTWTKVSDLIDNGKWYAYTSNNKPYVAKCNRAGNYIITNPGNIVSFSSENMIWNFKDLSVREIQPPK